MFLEKGASKLGHLQFKVTGIHVIQLMTGSIAFDLQSGRGRDAWGLADLHIEDRLRHYMSGGSEPTDVCMSSQKCFFLLSHI